MFTGVKNFCLQSVAHACASVWSGRPQSADVCLVVRTCSFDTCVCGAMYAFSRIFSPFLLSKHHYIVKYRRKNTFSFRRDCQLLCCHSAPLLWRCRSLVQHVFLVFQSTFSRVHCGISACKQSALCCYDGFCTNLCCANVDVLHHNLPAYK